ncbi:MAG TPA: outer membrane protein assembly factor BamD [Spirochaetota bacterium]|nr:outer membrane protein assembly factor BamD [Spirochaetota bacterium]HOM38299.1 outer membrane protein assembly factor BamD [Spirochaetota bacterium]HPQ48483.1 outer membrane protein assembly factor BamD [Spirochaetota bacterium]
MYRIVYLILFIIFFSSCAKNIKPASYFETPKEIYEEGLKLLSEKEYNHALEYFQYIVDNFPNDEKYSNWSIYEIGFIYYLKGDEEKAIYYLNKVLQTSKIKGPRVLASLVKTKIEKNEGYKNTSYKD